MHINLPNNLLSSLIEILSVQKYSTRKTETMQLISISLYTKDFLQLYLDWKQQLRTVIQCKFLTHSAAFYELSIALWFPCFMTLICEILFLSWDNMSVQKHLVVLPDHNGFTCVLINPEFPLQIFPRVLLVTVNELKIKSKIVEMVSPSALSLLWCTLGSDHCWQLHIDKHCWQSYLDQATAGNHCWQPQVKLDNC